VAIWIALCAGAFACRQDPQIVEPLAVSAADAPVVDDQASEESDIPRHVRADGDAPKDTARPGAPSGIGSGGGLWVIDAKGKAVGLLVQRGHPHQGQVSSSNILRDGVLVWSPAAGLFFGVEMVSGKVLVPRLGVADGACNLPLVAGYYTAGPEKSGMNYAFAWRGAWYRVQPGAALKLVSCSGITKEGVEPLCVLHSGSCRGFPVSKVSTPLPQSFAAPLRFYFAGGGS